MEEFEIPESLDGLDLGALAQLETDAVAAFDALREDPDLNSEGLARLRQLATFVRQVRDRQGQIEQAAAQVASELDQLDATVHGGEDETDGANDADDVDGTPGATRTHLAPRRPGPPRGRGGADDWRRVPACQARQVHRVPGDLLVCRAPECRCLGEGCGWDVRVGGMPGPHLDP